MNGLQISSNFDILNIVLPSTFSRRVQESIENNTLGEPQNRLAFIRECVSYFESQLKRPTAEEYTAISKKICETYPVMKNPNHTKYGMLILGWGRTGEFIKPT